MSEFLQKKIEVVCLLIAVALMGCSRPQDTMKLEAIVPTKEINSLGMAGDQPADISPVSYTHLTLPTKRIV